MAQVGDIIGNYRLVEELACGSFGCVYRAAHTVLTTRIVAIKTMHVHLQSQQERDSFFHEARLLEVLQHPHILPLLDVGIDQKTPYLITAYAPGGSLRQRLNRQAGQPLPFEEALSLLEQIAQALDHAHQQNIIHRDLKPENLLFDAQGKILLADFGIASVLGSLSFRQTSSSGTPPYMSPEQFKGEVSRESDQYALGVIAYELLTGQKPFVASEVVALMYKHLMEQPAPPRQFNPNLPEYVEQAIMHALAKERKQRFSDVLAFVSALQTEPLTSKQWFDEGYALGELKRYEEAIAAYEQAIRLDPNYAAAYGNKGNALGELKRYEEAIAAYEQAIRLDPNYAAAYGNKGNALRDFKRYAEALAAYEQVIRLDPNLAPAYYGKGAALWYLKRNEEALAAYEQAIRLDPKLALAYIGKGYALNELKRNEEALAAYEQAIRLDPNDAYAYHNKGIALRALNRNKEADEAFQKARELGENP
jgi:tetratricopeptide (TPR) repeat protein